MTISVIIPTLNSSATFEATMASLRQQTVAPGEIIVADGQSRDSTRDIATRYGARVVDNHVVHAAGGRNRGIETSSGDWLAFTDSDCILPPGWLELALARIHSMPDLVALGGPMRAHPPRGEIERVAGDALLLGVLRFDDVPRRLRIGALRGALITANVFYRRDALDAIGRFDERFENYGEDIDLFYRMVARYPGRVFYDPQLYIEHQFPRSYAQLYRKWVQYGMASSYLLSRYAGRWHLDTSHYRRLGASLLDTLTARDGGREAARARVVQTGGHLIGKYMGSLRRRVLNL